MTITGGCVPVAERIAVASAHVRRVSCPVVRHQHDARGIAVVSAGSLDRSDELDVPMHIWVKRKQPWVTLPEDAEMYDEAAPAEAIVRLFTR